MEGRKIKGWRARLEEKMAAARDDVWSFGARTQGARAKGSGLDFREKDGAEFDDSVGSQSYDRRVNERERSAASERLAELVKLVAAERRDAARRRASEWYHSRTKQERAERLARARERRSRYRERELAYAKDRRERIRNDPELAQLQAEYLRERWEALKADPDRHAAHLAKRREKRAEKRAQMRLDPVAEAAYLAKRRQQQRAYREANREQHLANKRRQYQRRKAKGTDPA